MKLELNSEKMAELSSTAAAELKQNESIFKLKTNRILTEMVS